MLIRSADSRRDGGACASIYAPYVLDTAISFEQEPPSAEEIERRIGAIGARFPWLIAEEDGVVIGYAYASAHHERAAYRWAADVAVYIDREHRRRGAGRALYETLLSLLERQGLFVACAGITLPNPASVALHETCGFEPIGVYPRIGWKLGSWHDVGWWQRELRPAASAGGSVSGEQPPDPGPPPRL
jgi:phosphinothricin acetyltransferase